MQVIGWVDVAFGAVCVAIGATSKGYRGPLLVQGGSAIGVGWALVRLRPWAYRAAMALALIGIATGVTGILLGGSVFTLPLLVNAVILFYLWSLDGGSDGGTRPPSGRR